MTRNRLWAGFFFLTVMLVMIIGGCGKSDPVVAFIGDKDQITLSELKTDMLRGRPESQWNKFSEMEIRAYLEKAIDNKVTMVAALDAGMDTDEAVLANYRPRYQNVMLRKLYLSEVFDKVIPEKDIRSFYMHEGRKVHFGDILIKYPHKNPSIAEMDSVKAIADSIYQRLRKGEDFGLLAKKLSQHPTSAQNDGKVGVVAWTTAADPIRNVLWEMRKGEISEPVANYKGFHIVQVNDIENMEKEPLEKSRERIRKILERERTQKLRDRAQEFWVELKNDRQVVFDDEKVKAWAEWFESIDNNCGIIKEALEALPQEKKDEVLVKWDKGSHTIQLVADRIAEVDAVAELRLGREDILSEFYERYMQAEFLTDRAESDGIHEIKEYREELTRLKNNEIIRVFIEREILGDIAVSDEEIRAHYEATKESKYKDKERIRIREIMVKDKTLAERIARMAKQGQNFGRLAEKYTERPNHKKVKGQFAWFTKGRWGKIGEVAFGLKKNQVYGPLYLEKENAYSVFKLTERRLETHFPFNDVEKRVKSDLILSKKNQKKEFWLKNIRKKYDIRLVDKEIARSVSKNG